MAQKFLLLSAVASFAVSSQALACPDFLGKYSDCETNSRLPEFQITSVTIHQSGLTSQNSLQFDVSLKRGEKQKFTVLPDGLEKVSEDKDSYTGKVVRIVTRAECDQDLTQEAISTLDGSPWMTELDLFRVISEQQLIWEYSLNGKKLGTLVCHIRQPLAP